MTLDTTLRISEVLLACAIMHQSLEHLAHRDRTTDPILFTLRLILCVPLVFGFASSLMLSGLWLLGLSQLLRYQGPYNGGSDKMTMLVLTCLTAAHLAPDMFWSEMAVSYLAVQLVLSYFVSGWIKVTNPAWRRGLALCDVFRYSAYPVSEQLRGLANHPWFLLVMGWSVILLELIFPFTLLHPATLKVALVCTAGFHFSNACFFGLNRFFWIWLCAYPSLIWFQDRVMQGS